jgi:hypothetical protein
MNRRSAATALAAVLFLAFQSAAVADRLASSGQDSSLGSPLFGSPEALTEAERTLTPRIDRVPLQDAMRAKPVERSHAHVSPDALASRSDWQRRAFAYVALVALACAAVAAVAALLTIGRRD